jgi:hypothetical protein
LLKQANRARLERSNGNTTNCSGIIYGFMKNQLKTNAHKLFDKITRFEQKKIEHVNCFLEVYTILRGREKEGFRHSIDVFASVFSLLCSIYNYKKLNNYY